VEAPGRTYPLRARYTSARNGIPQVFAIASLLVVVPISLLVTAAHARAVSSRGEAA